MKSLVGTKLLSVQDRTRSLLHDIRVVDGHSCSIIAWISFGFDLLLVAYMLIVEYCPGVTEWLCYSMWRVGWGRSHWGKKMQTEPKSKQGDWLGLRSCLSSRSIPSY